MDGCVHSTRSLSRRLGPQLRACRPHDLMSIIERHLCSFTLTRVGPATVHGLGETSTSQHVQTEAPEPEDLALTSLFDSVMQEPSV